MRSILKIALRNLMRYKRRTLLTSFLITIGVVAVLLFVAILGSFKAMMIGQITDSMLGHFQIHKKGYMASIDSLPLHMNLGPKEIDFLNDTLDGMPEVEAYSPRIKFGGMFSNFEETTNIRLNGVDPEKEVLTAPLLMSRILQGKTEGKLLEPGEILVPEMLAKGLKLKLGDTIVIVATNRDGSVNAKTLAIRGVLEGLTGPGGRDGYIHIEDAREILRITKEEANEYAVRLKNIDDLERVDQAILASLGNELNSQGNPKYEVHTWQKLSPFNNIAEMIDVMNLFVKLMLISIVLISIMNVMIMAVFERIKEIGTIAAIGTKPNKILSLFLAEGLLLGVLGAAIGTALSLVSILVLNIVKIEFSFGRQSGMLLSPTVDPGEIIFLFFVVILVSAVASLQPAYKASKMEPVIAMRHI